MDSKTHSRIKLSQIVIGVLIGLAAPKALSLLKIYAIDIIADPTNGGYEVVFTAHNSGFLEKNDAITRNGVYIGKIKSIELNEGGSVNIAAKIISGKKIYSTPHIYIQEIGFSGKSIISITDTGSPGQFSNIKYKEIASNDTLIAYPKESFISSALRLNGDMITKIDTIYSYITKLEKRKDAR